MQVRICAHAQAKCYRNPPFIYFYAPLWDPSNGMSESYLIFTDSTYWAFFSIICPWTLELASQIFVQSTKRALKSLCNYGKIFLSIWSTCVHSAMFSNRFTGHITEVLNLSPNWSFQGSESRITHSLILGARWISSVVVYNLEDTRPRAWINNLAIDNNQFLRKAQHWHRGPGLRCANASGSLCRLKLSN